LMSSSSFESPKTEQKQQPITDKRQRLSESSLRSSSFTEQTWKPIEQLQAIVVDEPRQPTNIEPQVTLPITQPKVTEQIQPEEKMNTKTYLSSVVSSSPVDRSVRQPVDEYHTPIKREVKPEVQRAPVHQTAPSTITKSRTIETQKSTATEDDEDDDGFRVVRYRKHVPAS
ncbi:unnamed protein product, partial [Adineta steineri]